MTSERIHSPGQEMALEAAFPQFTRLPPELRVMIWELCIPNRVIELNQPPELIRGATGCRRASPRRRLLPTIAYVNHQARAEVLRHLFEMPRLQFGGRWTPTEDFSVQNNRDIVVLYNSHPVDLLHSWRGDPRIRNIFQQIQRHAADVAICSVRTQPHSNGLLNILGLRQVLIPFTGWHDPLIIMRDITIHATRAEVAPTGLFGLLGDAPIQLVDPFDEREVSLYCQLYRDVQCGQNRSTSRFFDTLEDLTGLVWEEVRRAQTREVWLWWLEWSMQGFAGIEDPDHIFVPYEETLDLDMRSVATFTGDDANSDIRVDLFTANEGHPLVQNILSHISYTPRVMFRWCDRYCHGVTVAACLCL
ncbi:hypothetical protein PDE_06392 [Penicillium oxalicum 114-2]|uniref:2EXR domain-containing protein n=1 Tax=Penicillium oxalicum (strain 114-2 / CGMCC 5302) TaxID=933388 RepID=S8B9I0_PENO1|nr:hypothetical protein PDE_06392 [Penicillium oxalicum 114-2]